MYWWFDLKWFIRRSAGIKGPMEDFLKISFAEKERFLVDSLEVVAGDIVKYAKYPRRSTDRSRRSNAPMTHHDTMRCSAVAPVVLASPFLPKHQLVPLHYLSTNLSTYLKLPSLLHSSWVMPTLEFLA